MTAAVLERPGSTFEHPASRFARPTPGGRGTLDELLTATLHEARTNGSAECPVCHARMTPARAREAAAAECASCGSRLS
jgi:hypothetical protein